MQLQKQISPGAEFLDFFTHFSLQYNIFALIRGLL